MGVMAKWASGDRATRVCKLLAKFRGEKQIVPAQKNVIGPRMTAAAASKIQKQSNQESSKW